MTLIDQLTLPFRRLLWPPSRPTVDADGLLRLLTKGLRSLRWDRSSRAYVAVPPEDVTIPVSVVRELERWGYAEPHVDGEGHTVSATELGQRAARDAMYRRSAEKLRRMP
jgi:hypothetical protein